ncbi:MAG TPA: hypothetical protein VFM18_03205, partial [Methanosarcina sp.]|nr:hypothetical protein [Methanosarcina sp.]
MTKQTYRKFILHKGKVIGLIILFLGNFCVCYSQEWIRYYGSADFQCVPSTVSEHYDRGYLLVGNKADYKYAWLVKTDINGNRLWDKKIGDGNSYQGIFYHSNTSDNGLIISGSWSKYGDQMDALLIKLNKCGEVDWCTDFYTSEIPVDWGQNVVQTTDHGYIMLGLYNDGIHSTHLFKFDSTGSLEWHKYYLPDSLGFGESATNLAVDSAGLIITEYIYYPMPGQTGGWIRPYFIRTDLDGNEEWSSVYTNGGYYIGDAWATARNNFGSFYNTGRHNAGYSHEHPVLIKLDSMGNDVFNRDLIENAEEGDATSILLLHDTTLIIHGGWTIPNQDTIPCGVVKCDTMGNVIKTKKLPLYSRGWSSAKTFDDKLLFLDLKFINDDFLMALTKLNLDLDYDTVYSQPLVYDSLCPGGIVSDTLDPDCNLVVNIDEP